MAISMTEMKELLSSLKITLEQGMAQSASPTPWPVRLGDCRYAIHYHDKTYYVPKEIHELYELLRLTEPDYVLAKLSALAKSCQASSSIFGKNSFLQKCSGTARTSATQDIFNWLRETLIFSNTPVPTSEVLCNQIVEKLQDILKTATNPTPWPVGWAGAAYTLTIDTLQKTVQVPKEIYRLYSLADMHRDPQAHVKKVKTAIAAFQKTLEQEKKAWEQADVFDYPILYIFGLRDQSVHDLGKSLGDIIAKYDQQTSTPKPI